MNNSLNWNIITYRYNSQGVSESYFNLLVFQHGVNALDSHNRSILWFLIGMQKWQIDIVFQHKPDPFRHPFRPTLYWPEPGISNGNDVYIIEKMLSMFNNCDYMRKKPNQDCLADFEEPISILDMFHSYFKERNAIKSFGTFSTHEKIMLQYDTAMNYINRHCTFFGRLIHLIS